MKINSGKFNLLESLKLKKTDNSNVKLTKIEFNKSDSISLSSLLKSENKDNIPSKSVLNVEVGTVSGVTKTFSSNNPSNEEIFNKIESLQKELHVEEKLTSKQKNSVKKFSSDQKQILVTSLIELENLKERKTDASEYMFNIMQKAADLSGNNSKKFVQLVGEAFSEVEGSFDFFRKVLGAGAHTSGNIMEPLLEEVIKLTGGSQKEAGFNENMTDDVDVNNTMTHHYGEFIQVGYHRGETLGKIAAYVIDTNIVFPKMPWNEGDVRSGYFASMIGDALNDKKITPQNAVDLSKWAYTSHHESNIQPFYGTKEKQGGNLDWGDYKIEKWIKEYNIAFPDKKINQ